MAARFEDKLLYLKYMKQKGNECECTITERGDPFEEVGDRKFVERFRLSKQTVSFLVKIIHNLQFPMQRNCSVYAMNRLLTALRYYETGSFDIVVGDIEQQHLALYTIKEEVPNYFYYTTMFYYVPDFKTKPYHAALFYKYNKKAIFS